MARQQTVGVTEALVVFTAIRADKAREVVAHFPQCLRVTGDVTPARGTKNRNLLTVPVEYGPVRGAWASDIRRKVRRALDAVGSTAQFELENVTRRRVI